MEFLQQRKNADEVRMILAYSVQEGIDLYISVGSFHQAHVAEDMRCDVLLTINEKHFRQFSSQSSVRVLTPEQFVEVYKLS